MQPISELSAAIGLFIREPTGFPILGQGGSQTDRINFLSHDLFLSLVVAQNDFQMTGAFADASGRAACFRTEPTDDRTRADERRLNGERLTVYVAVVFSVGDGGTQGLADQDSRFTRAEINDRERLDHAFSLDQAGHMTRLFRRNPDVFG